MRISILFSLFFMLLSAGFAVAQESQSPPPRFEASVTALDSVTMKAGENTIHLWGVTKLADVEQDMSARSALERAIGSGKVTCETKQHSDQHITALCTNADNQDLGLHMLRQGLVAVDRPSIAGTPLEKLYIDAEGRARTHRANLSLPESDGNRFVLVSGIVVFFIALAVFSALATIMLRGFQKIADIQKQNMDMMERERKLKEKERSIVAIMLDSELKANKSKIEAYRLVYSETLKALMEIGRTPKYKKSGDIVQKQPALSRAVFDRNTDKLDMLGPDLASQIVHYYARVKSNPEYITIEPSMPIEEAINLLEGVLKNAKKLEELSEKLLSGFRDFGIISADYRD